MQRAFDLDLPRLRSTSRLRSQQHLFVVALGVCVIGSALMASWLPLQVSIVTVFLFAGPHNWFELRYFLQRLPVRFGRSRNFFIVAFSGIGILTLTYVVTAVVFTVTSLPESWWPWITATWNSALLVWLATLVWLRGKQKRCNWAFAFPIAFAVSAVNWLMPELFSLSIVYLHPLAALWFLDRHLVKNRREWLKAYRRCLAFLPFVLMFMIWRLSLVPSLSDDNGLFWRITQHSGAQLLPFVSSHMLVSVHLFLEMLHYAVWLLALPLIVGIGEQTSRSVEFVKCRPYRLWDLRTIGIARHPRGYPKLIATLLVLAVVVVLMLWLGFSVDYATTRDIYFTVAIAHVLAEAPFLLKMI